MPSKRDQENQPTPALNTLDSDTLSPPKAAARKSTRNSGGKAAQLNEVPPNEADRTTVPAKRRGRTKPGKEANKEASPDTSGDQPPTTPSAPKARSKAAANNITTAASKGTPSAIASVTQSSNASAKRRTNTNNAAPPPKTPNRREATSAQPNGNHGPHAPGNDGGSKLQASKPTTAAGGVTKGASKSAGAAAAKARKDADGPVGADKSGGASTTDPEVQKELEYLRAQLAREKKKNKKASQSSAMKKSKTKPQPQPLIPRPSGTLGKDWHLQAAMGLSHDKPLYSKILSDVRKLVIKALDTSKGIRKQDPVKLGAIYEVARNQRPLLAQFENDWATSQIIIQYLSNVRKQESSSESESEDDNAKRGRERSSDANRGQKKRQHAGKHTHKRSLEAEGRLRAARAVLGGGAARADNPSGESGDEVEDEMAGDPNQEGSCDEDEVEVEVEDENEGRWGEDEGGAQASADGDGNGDEDEENEDEDEDEGLEMPPAKRRRVAQVLPEDA